jgi:hypothetical protein
VRDGKFEEDPPEKSRCNARIAKSCVGKSVPLYRNMIPVSFGLLCTIFRLTFSLKKYLHSGFLVNKLSISGWHILCSTF